MDRVTRQYLKEIVSRHGVPVSIISDRDGSIKAAPFEALYERHAESVTMERGDTFWQTGKLNPRYIGPFKILAKRCLSDETLAIPLDEIQIDDKLHFIKELVEIIDREVKRLKQSRIPIVKVCWNSRRGPEFTWEHEDQMQKKYPHLFTNSAPVTDVTT
ncbi:hypothetical protein Tco_0964312 [Tanacetum coccineum]